MAIKCHIFNVCDKIRFSEDMYKWDECQGIVETSALVQTVQNLLPGSDWIPTNESCKGLFDAVEGALLDENRSKENDIGCVKSSLIFENAQYIMTFNK